jgi:cytochrome c556
MTREEGYENWNLDDRCTKLKIVIMEVAEQTCGKKWVNTKRKKTRWWSQTVFEAVKRKKEAWEKYIRMRSPLDLENYRTARNEAKQTVKEAKENSWIEFGEEMESNYQRNNHRFWKVLKSIRGKYGKQVRSVKNRNNVLVTKTAEVLAVWKDYFEEKFCRVEIECQCKRSEVKDKDREAGTEMEN